MVASVTTSAAAPLAALPAWVRLVRAANPGPLTLEGTNTWVLRSAGERACVVVDPGPLDPDHQTAVARLAPVAAILVTHAHPDHRDGLARLSELTGAEELRPANGCTIDVAGIKITSIATPGHTADSISLLADHAGEVVIMTGDTILGRGTTVVAYPDGDLGEYLASLRRLEQVGPVAVLPGHGPALADCAEAARFYLAHRLARLEQVRAARAAGARDPAAIVASVYGDLDPALWPAAELSARAQLAYLDQAGAAPGRDPVTGTPP